MKILTFDTETTGRLDYRAGDTADTQPHLVQLGAILEANNQIVASLDVIIQPTKWTISDEVSKIHGITHEMAMEVGISIANAVYLFRDLVAIADRVVAHNMAFDKAVMIKAVHDAEVPEIPWRDIDTRCTMLLSTPVLKIPKTNSASSRLSSSNWKWPSLAEAVRYFYNEEIVNAHSAMVDTAAARKVYHALRQMGVET